MTKKKKSVLVFGASGSIGNSFIARYKNEFDILPVYRNSKEGMNFDFEKPEEGLRDLKKSINQKLDGILFCQGVNPERGFFDMDEKHFMKMLRINLVTPLLIVQELHDILSDQCLVLLFSSIAKRKGSYDPSYATAKSGMTGLMHSMSNVLNNCRVNMLSLGLVEGSRVEKNMTKDFIKKHTSRMFKNRLVQMDNVTSAIYELIQNESINRSDISIDGGYA